MKKYSLVLSIFFTLVSCTSFSQNCFEIESILVDACAPAGQEQDNEMVRFKIGASPLNVSALNITWFSGAFTGICQNANTAQKVIDLNSAIISCGYLLEPVAGVLPANSNVILVTSENMNTASNSFANLTDTIYILFQCGNSSIAHFKNHYPVSGTNGNPRTLKIDFGAACVDSVFYIPDSLVNELGLLTDTLQDGSSVSFDPSGNQTYYNNGCQAPIITLNAIETVSDDTTCTGATLTLTATNLTGNYSSFFWTGGQGIIASPSNLISSYQTNASFTGTDYITFAMIGQCNDTIRDSVAIFIQSGSVASITGSSSVCAGDTIVLTANSSASYLWSNGLTTQSISVTQPGSYTVTVSGSCGTSSATLTVNGGSAPSISVSPGTNVTICNGQSITLTASGASSYQWSTGAGTAAITVNAAGVYTVLSSNSCGIDSVQVTVTQSSTASVSITSNNGTTLCPGQSTTLSAVSSGATGYTWSSGQSASSISVNTPGTYTVTITSTCGTATASQLITGASLPVAQITSPSTILCTGSSLTLTANGGNNYVWNTGATTNFITVTQTGAYKAYVTNNCGTDSATVTISASTVNAAFTPSPQSGFAPLMVDFTNNSVSNAANAWNFGDGNTANSANAQNTYTTAGSYTVTLMVTDNGSCTSTTTGIIDVLADTATILIPNVITPNGDGVNDLFSIVGATIRYADVDIYNRWGQRIKQYSRYDKGTEIGWDALDADEGVYYYVITMGLKNGDIKEYRGSVTVVR